MNRTPFPFEKLEVWQRSRALVRGVDHETRKFPKSEMIGLSTRLSRAVVSVACHPAEGSGRTSPRDRARISNLDVGSLMGAARQVILSCDLGCIGVEKADLLLSSIQDPAARTHNLRKSRLRRAADSQQPVEKRALPREADVPVRHFPGNHRSECRQA